MVSAHFLDNNNKFDVVNVTTEKNEKKKHKGM